MDDDLCSRLCDVHVKDMNEDGTFVRSGLGAVDWRPILERLVALEYEGPLTLEAHLGSDLDGVRRSVEWLRGVLEELAVEP
jgi:sugar phosphate isomerase/epimerase